MQNYNNLDYNYIINQECVTHCLDIQTVCCAGWGGGGVLNRRSGPPWSTCLPSVRALNKLISSAVDSLNTSDLANLEPGNYTDFNHVRLEQGKRDCILCRAEQSRETPGVGLRTPDLQECPSISILTQGPGAQTQTCTVALWRLSERSEVPSWQMENVIYHDDNASIIMNRKCMQVSKSM